MSEFTVFTFVTSGISKSSSPGIRDAVVVVVVVNVVGVGSGVACGGVVDASLDV